MNLFEVADGTVVFLDANVFVYAAERRSLQCRHLLERCDREALHAVSSVIALAEVCHRRMINEAKEAGLISGSNPSRLLANKRGVVPRLGIYAENVCALLDSTIPFEPIQPQDFFVALELQKQHDLLTNDSLNLAVAKRLGIKGIATADASFDRVQGFTVYKPTDIVSS